MLTGPEDDLSSQRCRLSCYPTAMAPSIKLPMVRWASSASCCLFTTPLALARCSRQRALSVSAARAQSTANSQVSSSSEASTSKQTQFTPNKLQHTSTSSATSNSSSRKQSGGPRLLRLPGKAHQLGRVSAVTYAEEIAVPSLIEALHQNRLVGCGKVTDARKPAGFQMFTNMRSRNERKVNIEGEALLLPHWFGGQCFLFENGGGLSTGINPLHPES